MAGQKLCILMQAAIVLAEVCAVDANEAMQKDISCADSGSVLLSFCAPCLQVQQRAATLLLSVEASPMPDSTCIQATARALAQLLKALGRLIGQVASGGAACCYPHGPACMPKPTVKCLCHLSLGSLDGHHSSV